MPNAVVCKIKEALEKGETNGDEKCRMWHGDVDSAFRNTYVPNVARGR